MQTICKKLKLLGQFDLNVLDALKRVNTKDYDDYDMFLIFGKYIFENNLAKCYIDLLKTKPEGIRKEGKVILQKSIDYVLKLCWEKL